MRLCTERSGNRLPARTRLFLLAEHIPTVFGNHLEGRRLIFRVCTRLTTIPPLSLYTPSTGVSTTVRGVFVKVTNLMAVQFGPRLTCNYYLATCLMGIGVLFRDEGASSWFWGTQRSLEPMFMFSWLWRGQPFQLSCVLFILGLINDALNISDNSVVEGLWVI